MINGASESIVNFGEDFQFETDDHSAPIVNFDADLSWAYFYDRIRNTTPALIKAALPEAQKIAYPRVNGI